MQLKVVEITGRGYPKDGVWIVGPQGEWLCCVMDGRDMAEPGDILPSTEGARAFARKLVERWNAEEPIPCKS